MTRKHKEKGAMEPEKPKIKKDRSPHLPKPKKKNQKFGPKSQEATPELLRIEIDQIFKTFLGDPDVSEFKFPSNLNKLQRQYIHQKARIMNIISKSYGKEPDRQLHIFKRNKQVSSKCFPLIPSQKSQEYLKEFGRAVAANESSNNHRLNQKNFARRLVNGPPTIPSTIQLPVNIIENRMRLPIYEKKDAIIEIIKTNQIVIISSETGSGKTTQIPQYIMEDSVKCNIPCKIICTQPRRISTVAAAERVAYERCDTLGASVGYHIKLEQKYGINTNLIYCTTGVFLRNLLFGFQGLKNVTHIILDEIHERDKLSDFLLICLKQALPKYPNVKIILMSATLNSNKFINYFGCGETLHIPGHLFVIDCMFLEEILILMKYMTPRMRQIDQEKKKLLVYNEAEIHPKDSTDTSLLDEALEEYLNFSPNYDYKIHYEMATAQLNIYFLSEGVSVDYQHSKNGRTALMIASFLGDKEFITRLCNMGANMDLACKLGKTALDYAEKNSEIVRLLEYLKISKEHDDDECRKEAEHLLQLYDKTTIDDAIDYDLITTLIRYIHNSGQVGSILVFLPGYDDIMICGNRIQSTDMNQREYKIFFLHGSMNIKDQNDVFQKLPNKRKIILSTNIAETSITIEDVVFVIDSGKAKEKCYDSYNKVSSLQTQWISKACSKQRMGRAGRTQPGMCFRLYSKQRYESMEEERVPELLRVSLEELCLHAKIMAPEGMNIHNFLTMAPDTPSANTVKVAIENLQFLGALDKEEDLTKLGEYLAQLTIDPHLGKMLLYSIIFRCLEPVLTLTAAMTHKDPFLLPPQANLKSRAAEKRKQLINGILSDHILYLRVFQNWQESCCNGSSVTFCKEFFVSHSTMNSILETRTQLLGQLRASRFVHESNNLDEYNQNANCWPLVKAIICSGCYPNVAFPLNKNLSTRTEKKVNIHSSSACGNKVISTWLLYDDLIKQRHVLVIRGVTAVSSITIPLLCGNDVIYSDDNIITIDDWVEFKFPNNTVIVLRDAMEALIKTVLRNPSYKYNRYNYLTISTLKNVLDAEEAHYDLQYPVNVGERPAFFFPLNEDIKWNRLRSSRRAAVGQMNAISNSSKDNHNSLKKHVKYNKRSHTSNHTDFRKNNVNMCESVASMQLASRSNAECLMKGICGLPDYQDNKNYSETICQNRQNFTEYKSIPDLNMCDSFASMNLSDQRKAELLMNGICGISEDYHTKAFLEPECQSLSHISGLIKLNRSNSVGRNSKKFSESKPSLYMEKSVDFSDKKIFILIKPKQKRNVEIAQSTSRWIFAPQTEKKILHFIGEKKPVYLIFTVHQTYALQGIAKFIYIYNEHTGKPTAQLEWMFKDDMPYDNIRHLKNPYNDNKPLYDGLDGQIIEQHVAEELYRIYEGISYMMF